MKKFLTLLMFGVFIACVPFSHAITSIPIDGVKASATLLDKGKESFRPENLIMKKNVSPFYQVWGAPFNDNTVTLEFTVGAQQVNVITLFNGNTRDSAAYENNSLARTIKIYLNSKNNLVKTVTLAKPKWLGHGKTHPDVIVFDPPIENVRKIIIEIESIYPGRKWTDVCIAMVKFWGFVKMPRKVKLGKMTDARDGKSYNTVKVGDQVWMAQDLQYRTPGSRSFTDPHKKKMRELPADAGYEYPESEIDGGICPEGWRLPKAAEFAGLRAQFPESASFDDFFATSKLKPFYAIFGSRSGGQPIPPNGEIFFYPTDAYGLNFSTLTRRYYEGECSEDHGEYLAFSSYWTLDSKKISLWPDDEGNVEVKSLKHYRFGGSDYCEAMLSPDSYHFVRCIKGDVMKDPRDGQMYKTVKIANRMWMEENLRFETGESGCYNGLNEYCTEYGRMYSWNAAQTVCPQGWHLPSDMEFRSLTEASGEWKVTNEVDELGFWAISRPECETDSCDAPKPMRYDGRSANISEETNSDGTQTLPVRCVKD